MASIMIMSIDALWSRTNETIGTNSGSVNRGLKLSALYGIIPHYLHQDIYRTFIIVDMEWLCKCLLPPVNQVDIMQIISSLIQFTLFERRIKIRCDHQLLDPLSIWIWKKIKKIAYSYSSISVCIVVVC
jgi:hypothetical protein